MDNSGNFILKVHMQDNDLKEVFLNKEKRCFTFVNDECIADLILPEFKLTSLKMLVKNVVSDKKNDDYYAEYNNEDLKVFEYDKEKVNLLAEMVTKITVNDFLEYIDRVKQNDFYIDNVVDVYNTTIPEEVKRLVSYTTNGFVFKESNLRVLAHEEILDSDFRKNKFIPIFECDNTYFGYDLNERKYARYVDGEVYKFYDSLRELLDLDSKEEEFEDSTSEKQEDVVKTQEEVIPEEEETLFSIITEKEDKVEKKDAESDKNDDELILPEVPVINIPKEKTKEEVNEKIDETIKNIDTQFERLNTQVESVKEQKNPYDIDIDSLFSNYKVEIPKSVYKNDIDRLYEEAKLEVDHLKDTNPYEMDIDSLFSNYKLGKKKFEISKDDIKEPEQKTDYLLGKDKLFDNYPDYELGQAKFEIDKDDIKEPKQKTDYLLGKDKLFDNYPDYELEKANFKMDKDDIKKPKHKTAYLLGKDKLFDNYPDYELGKTKFEINKENIRKPRHKTEYLLGKANLFKEETSPYQLRKTKFNINKSDIRIPKNNEEYEFVLSKELIDDIRDSVRKSLKKLEKEELAEIDLERLIDNSLTDSINNYRINYNDSMKLVVEHIPYYQNDNSFGVVQIPELEVKKHTLLPGIYLDFDKIKFKVLKLMEDKVELLIEKATNISNEQGDKIKKGDIIKMDSSTEIVYLLDKKDAMESWTFKMEKTVYDKELRRVEYTKLLNCIKAKTNYETLTNIEKVETQKSIMLFVDLISKNNETEKLDELYSVIKNKEDYAKYITEYNNNQAHKDKDSLPSYDHKKEFLEKLKYVDTLISTNAITYPRFIYSSFNYFDGEQMLEDYLEDLNNNIKENDFSNYLKKVFKHNEIFTNLDEVGKDNLNKCLEYLSVVYKQHPEIGEEEKYKIENALIITSEDEDIALLISKLCRKGIKDYNSFKEYDSLIKEEYRTGNLKYPLYSEDFDIEEVRKGGEYDEI